ncbi:membrane protein [Steroidobacter agaridevorans]|uniref:Membrane protein n=1 Tax=Steroidobacter agaridevorans TaxID=2695856 RepID=A0A829YCC5_9GAMM|nr:ABC transporter permease [Steroidobacter agaridevorans]GFE81044.1 membrane protein [Steroidobacter agaridevorans]GFE89072.1 membrane protein [Steroidobacter agaridevorans]
MSNNSWDQITAITSMNVRNMSQRAASSIVALIGIAGVVTVLIGVLSIAEGFKAVLEISGSDQVAIVLRNGATDEMGSGLQQEQTRLIADAKQAARDEQGPIVSPELYVVVDVPLKSTGTAANVPLRGVGPQAVKLRSNFKIVEGVNFTPGKFEVVVGKGASMQFSGLTVGSQLRLGTTNWTVTGIFEDRGSVAESEIWTDATVLQGAYNRGTSYQSMRVKLTSPSAMQAFKDELSTNPRLNVRVFSEKQYYAEQSKILVTLVSTIGSAIAILMGLGAIFAALNTMYSAVSSRTREIATLRALGFGPAPVITSVLAEALLIGLVGGVVGMVVSYVAFNGVRASTMNFATFSQLTFAFTVTPQLLVQGLVYALILGFIGGLLPSLRAAKLPITTGLREL